MMLMQPRYQVGYLFRANGAWHVRYYSTVTVDGQPQRKQVSKRLCDGDLNSKAVKQKFAEFMVKVNDELAPQRQSAEDRTVVDFWEKTYLPFIEENLKPSTISYYKHVWSKHLKEHFGTVLLKDYKTPACSVFLTHLAKTHRPRTVQHIKFLASSIFAHAVAVGACDTNPIRDAKVLGRVKNTPDTKVYSLEEIEDVISALIAHVECQLIMALAFFMGLRKGEIEGLQWGDVDNNFIHIRRSKWQGHVTLPKTKKSVRSVPIIQPVRGLLTLWKSKAGDGAWLFPNNLNTYSRKIIRPALTKAKLPWKGYHAGRRGLGTVLRSLTGNSNAGRDILGHSDEQVTQQHYEGAMPEEALKGMKLLEAKVSK